MGSTSEAGDTVRIRAYFCQMFNQLVALLHTVTRAAVGQSVWRHLHAHVHSSDVCHTVCSQILWVTRSEAWRSVGRATKGLETLHVYKRLWLPPSLSLLYDFSANRARRFEKESGNNLIEVFLKIPVFLGVIAYRWAKSGNRSCTFTECTQKTLYNEQTKISFDSNCRRTFKAAENRDRLTHWK